MRKREALSKASLMLDPFGLKSIQRQQQVKCRLRNGEERMQTRVSLIKHYLLAFMKSCPVVMGQRLMFKLSDHSRMNRNLFEKLPIGQKHFLSSISYDILCEKGVR